MRDLATRRPLHLCLAIDRSGSLAGQSFRYAIQAYQYLVDRWHLIFSASPTILEYLSCLNYKLFIPISLFKFS
jgi:hypothetical protein